MGIWGDFALRHFNISPLVEGLDGLGTLTISTMGPVDVREYVPKRNVSRQDAIALLQPVFPHVFETRQLEVLLRAVPTVFEGQTFYLPRQEWTGFYSRLDDIHVMAFRDIIDRNAIQKVQASLE